MKNILIKEFRLSVSPISLIFILFAFMGLIPGYPILMGAFFVSMGIFQSYQLMRDQNDILYSALLPVRKKDVVSAKYISAAAIELSAFIIMCAVTAVRLTVFRDAAVYAENPLMPADLVFLGFSLLIFAEFNLIFLGGFFKTAYYFGKPFVLFIIASTVTVGIGESLHYLPFYPADSGVFQVLSLILGIIIFVLLTLLSLKKAQNRFEGLDL